MSGPEQNAADYVESPVLSAFDPKRTRRPNEVIHASLLLSNNDLRQP